MEQIERIKAYILTWNPDYSEALIDLDITEAIQKVCNYLNDDVFPEQLEMTLAKELSKIYSQQLPSNAVSIKESETTIQLAEKTIDYDELVSSMKKSLFRFRKLK